MNIYRTLGVFSWRRAFFSKGLFFFLFSLQGFAQTIEEKVESYRATNWQEEENSCTALNNHLSALRKELKEAHERVSLFQEQEKNEEDFRLLLKKVNEIRGKIADLESRWRDLVVKQGNEEREDHAFWDEEEVTLSQLVMEYGSNEYLYVIPPNLLTQKVHLHSSIPIPRESWTDLLEVILRQSGIGVKQINPFAKQLYLLKTAFSAVSHILTNREDLPCVPENSRIAYIFSPDPERIHGVAQFFEKFRDQHHSFIYQVGYKIALVASKEEVEKLLTLHDAIWEKENGKVAEIISTSRLTPSEMEKILSAYFHGTKKRIRIGRYRGDGDELVFFPLKEQGSLVLIGPKELVLQAKQIAKNAEEQIEDPMEMTVFWYTCRHSDPENVADALEKVYNALVYSKIEGEIPPSRLPPRFNNGRNKEGPIQRPEYGPPPYSPVAQPPSVVAPNLEEQNRKSKTKNFVPYPTTGSIMMVVRRDTLEKIKELLRKIDIPKKMVRIEALFFEKRINNESQFGLSSLNWGASASNTRASGASYTQPSGIVQFFIKRAHNSFWRTFDIAYNFLLKQTDIRINAAPSTVTLNQTPAQISIVEEVSISDGAAPIDNGNVGSVVFRESFSRAQFGINLVVTPTVHDPILGEEEDYSITLETDIGFDTFSSEIGAQRKRPNVMRRKVQNCVRVSNGETVILGGLRRKEAEDSNNKLPFLGEIPGIGKLFSNSRTRDRETEMFVFITPKIVFTQKERFERDREEELRKRPGDIPEFLERVEEAKAQKKKCAFEKSLKLIFGGNNG